MSCVARCCSKRVWWPLIPCIHCLHRWWTLAVASVAPAATSPASECKQQFHLSCEHLWLLSAVTTSTRCSRQSQAVMAGHGKILCEASLRHFLQAPPTAFARACAQVWLLCQGHHAQPSAGKARQRAHVPLSGLGRPGVVPGRHMWWLLHPATSKSLRCTHPCRVRRGCLQQDTALHADNAVSQLSWSVTPSPISVSLPAPGTLCRWPMPWPSRLLTTASTWCGPWRVESTCPTRRKWHGLGHWRLVCCTRAAQVDDAFHKVPSLIHAISTPQEVRWRASACVRTWRPCYRRNLVPPCAGAWREPAARGEVAAGPHLRGLLPTRMVQH